MPCRTVVFLAIQLHVGIACAIQSFMVVADLK